MITAVLEDVKYTTSKSVQYCFVNNENLEIKRIIEMVTGSKVKDGDEFILTIQEKDFSVFNQNEHCDYALTTVLSKNVHQCILKVLNSWVRVSDEAIKSLFDITIYPGQEFALSVEAVSDVVNVEPQVQTVTQVHQIIKHINLRGKSKADAIKQVSDLYYNNELDLSAVTAEESVWFR